MKTGFENLSEMDSIIENEPALAEEESRLPVRSYPSLTSDLIQRTGEKERERNMTVLYYSHL